MIQKKFLLSFVLILLSTLSVIAQNIISGPMLGYSEMREVALWLQVDQEMHLSIEYWIGEGKKQRTEETITTKEKDHSLKFIISELEPGQEYSFRVLERGFAINEDTYKFKTQELWQYRTDPPNLKFALGSCAYINEEKYDRPGKSYGGDYQIFESIADKDIDFMMWLGDNVYLREVDWNSRAGFIHRYSHCRQIPELQNLLQSCNHYAIWDDHDFGPNDSNGSFTHKDISKEVFDMFWANNGSGLDDDKGITSQFQYGDLDFFLLDNRTYRTHPDAKGIESTILGQDQYEWLISALIQSKSPFKFVCVGGQFLNDQELYENYANYVEEREEILSAIEENNIEGVIFLTGDRHCASMSQLQLSNGTNIFEITSSPLTSKAYDNCGEGNTLMIDDTCYDQRNFATVEVKGKFGARELSIKLFNSEGEEIWEKKINSDYQISE